MGDPADKYELTEENIGIARQCGSTFLQLIDLGYLHLSPGTGNWTQAGELTDMADCYDLRKDKNLHRIVFQREHNWNQDFWESLIGPFHTSNLSPFFIEGVFGQEMPLRDAAEELKRVVFNKASLAS